MTMTNQPNATRLRSVFGRTPYRLEPVVLRMWPQIDTAQVTWNGKLLYVPLHDVRTSKPEVSSLLEASEN